MYQAPPSTGRLVTPKTFGSTSPIPFTPLKSTFAESIRIVTSWTAVADGDGVGVAVGLAVVEESTVASSVAISEVGPAVGTSTVGVTVCVGTTVLVAVDNRVTVGVRVGV
jgi:hypothetical protein